MGRVARLVAFSTGVEASAADGEQREQVVHGQPLEQLDVRILPNRLGEAVRSDDREPLRRAGDTAVRARNRRGPGRARASLPVDPWGHEPSSSARPPPAPPPRSVGSSRARDRRRERPRDVDPVRQPREDLAVLRRLTVAALILVLAGCGGSDPSDTSETTATVEATQTTTEATQTIASNDPLACLEEAGLSNAEERDLDFWRGLPRRAPLRDHHPQARDTGESPDSRCRDLRRDETI